MLIDYFLGKKCNCLDRDTKYVDIGDNYTLCIKCYNKIFDDTKNSLLANLEIEKSDIVFACEDGIVEYINMLGITSEKIMLIDLLEKVKDILEVKNIILQSAIIKFKKLIANESL